MPPVVGVGSSSDALGSFLQISFFVAAGGRRRFVAIALELEENAEGARVGSGVAGFHAMENVEGAAVGEAFERFGEAWSGVSGSLEYSSTWSMASAKSWV